MGSFQKLLQIGREEYKKWKPIYCPALEENVLFTMRGFNHLRFRKGSLVRDWKETAERLKLLRYVRDILQNASVIAGYRKRVVRSRRGSGEVEYWAIEGFVGKKAVRVIVMKTKGTKSPLFLSVMKK
ncbi:MAG TPA: hypothetical protein VJA87_01880 [Candidatus Paceibacterota bacterium]